MEDILLTCPHCGFFREIPRANVPQGAKSAACPECKRRFRIAEAMGAPGRVISGNSSDDWHYWGKLANHRARQDEERTADQRLSGVAPLLVEGWAIYRAKTVPLSVLYLYMLLLTAVPWLCYWQLKAEALPASTHWRDSLLVLLLVALTSMVGLVLGLGAMLRGAAGVDGGIAEPIRSGFSNFFGNVQLSCWMLFLLIGGACWLLLPAVIFAGYMSLAFFVYLHERERGLNAVCIGRHYVGGAFRDTLGKLVLLALLLLLGSLFVVTQIVVLPYVLVCLNLVYRDLRQNSQGTRCLADRNFRLRIVGPAVAAWVLLFLGLTLVVIRDGDDQVAARIHGLKPQIRGLLLDSWRLSGMSSPGCGLVLSKCAVNPGERMEVRLVSTSKIAQNYYVCVARDGEECYESLVVDQDIQKQRLFFISAPQQKGTYHLKVFTDYDRTAAVSSLEFQVI